MTRIDVRPDCGNAPKKAFLRDFNIAFARADRAAILACLDEGVRWDVVGSRTYKGKQGFAEALEAMPAEPALELMLHSIITHGRQGAASGVIRAADGTRYAFCDMYTFTGARGDRIAALESYVIELPADPPALPGDPHGR